MKKKLYKILGIKEDASPEEIKQAYRERAKEAHPDKQDGNAEDMKEINHAYAILKDTKKRERYDQTGDDDPQPDNTQAQMFELVAKILDILLQRDPFNIQKALADLSANELRAFNQNTHNNEKEIERLEKFAKRIKVHPENDIIGIILANNIANYKRNIEILKDTHEKHIKVYEFLSQYVFAEKEQQPQMHINNNYITNIQDFMETDDGRESPNFDPLSRDNVTVEQNNGQG